ncbi:MAG: cell division topological specificity factor MinE [Armatimonadetes bacterium]|nr:cell division topological specificity factor MinE [Armatimonadota bacterium]
MTIFDRWFGKKEDSAKNVARDRLRMVLQQDRSSIPAPIMEKIRADILAVLCKHLDIDEREFDIAVEREGEAVALTANIPIRRIRPEAA